MSADATDGNVVSLASRLRDALITMGSLTPQGALLIDKAMQDTGLAFGDAALQLGVITPEELAAAARAARLLSSKAPNGIVEGAIFRMSTNHGLPVRYVRTVKAGPSLTLVHDADNKYSEQIRALRTELMLLNGTSRTRNSTLVILSPCQGEGRTQLCAELAVAFSQLGQRTLLVDADLRRPRVHALFESENNVGLGQALASGAAPQLLAVQDLPHMSVLVAGPTVPNPLELLTNGHFQRQLTDWRKKFNVVIIDTPPITEYADGLAIASFADQVVIVGRSGATPHKNIKEMLRRMAGTQARVVGAVINSF